MDGATGVRVRNDYEVNEWKGGRMDQSVIRDNELVLPSRSDESSGQERVVREGWLFKGMKVRQSEQE